MIDWQSTFHVPVRLVFGVLFSLVAFGGAGIRAQSNPKFEAGFTPDTTSTLLGEKIGATFFLKNTGGEPIKMETGGDVDGPRVLHFEVKATGPGGEPVRDPIPDAWVRNSGGFKPEDPQFSTALIPPGYLWVDGKTGWSSKGKEDDVNQAENRMRNEMATSETSYNPPSQPKSPPTPTPSTPPLSKLLNDARPSSSVTSQEREMAIHGLNERAIDHLDSLSPADRRAIAAAFIAGLGDPAWRVRWASAQGIMSRAAYFRAGEFAGAADPLLKCLKDENESVRGEAGYALGELREPRAVAPLLALARDPSAEVRKCAGYGLMGLADARVGQPQLDAGLVGLLKSPDPEVRAAAAQCLGYSSDPRAVDPLLAALNDASDRVAGKAAEALGQRSEPRAVEPLIALMKKTWARELGSDSDEAFGLFTATMDALGRIKDPRAVGPIVEIVLPGKPKPGGAIHDPFSLMNDDFRRYCFYQNAAEALGRIGTPETIAPLIELLPIIENNIPPDHVSYPDPAVPLTNSAQEALKRITGQDFGKDPARYRAGLQSIWLWPKTAQTPAPAKAQDHVTSQRK